MTTIPANNTKYRL